MKELQPQVTHGLPATNDSDLIIDHHDVGIWSLVKQLLAIARKPGPVAAVARDLPFAGSGREGRT
jgi:hypothetical protein